MSDESASDCLGEIIETLKKYQLKAPELCIVYGNLGYSIGAALEGYTEANKGPSPEELARLHAEFPYKLGVAFMVEGHNITSWADQLEKAEEAAKIAEEKEND